MKYTDKQIKNAKREYSAFLRFDKVTEIDLEVIGRLETERRVDNHNNLVSAILNGNKELEREWKLFFLNEEVKKDQRKEASKAKKAANKAASADILEPIKSIRKLVAFGQWLNTSGNPFRKQHFNKKYTIEAVNAYLQTV